MNIPLQDDELIPNEELAKRWRTTVRTLWRYEKEPDGLPGVMVSGRKYRPWRRCQDWLARRIQQPNPRRKVAA
jgi:hypothetical protein